MPSTLEEYANLTPAQQKKLYKEDLQKIIDSQLALLNNDPEEIRNVITNAINTAIDKKLGQLTNDINTECKRISDENVVLRKAIVEQQKCMERLCNGQSKCNAFVTGIPSEINVNDEIIKEPRTIIDHILKTVSPQINENDYKAVKIFQPREGNTKYAAKLVFTSNESKQQVMSNSKKLNKLDANNVLRKVFIKNERTPLARKENDRLYNKLRTLRGDNPDIQYKIEKGKLMQGDQVIDEYNISNSIF